MKHTYSFAGVPIEVTYAYDYITDAAAAYETSETPVVRLEVTEADIDRERNRANKELFPAAYWESLAFLRQASDAMASHGAILFHGAAVAVDGRAYLFAAPSGTGKSTHISIWKSLLGDRMTIINGDKPFVRKVNGVFRVFSSPWNGKEGWGTKMDAPIEAICFLHRSATNEIEKIDSRDAFRVAYRQCHRPADVQATRHVMLTMTELINSCSLYSLGCNMLPEAGKLSFETMTGGAI